MNSIRLLLLILSLASFAAKTIALDNPRPVYRLYVSGLNQLDLTSPTAARKAWAPAQRLFTTGPGDMGYPSTAQLPDGKLVTVFYAQKSPLHDGYHMGAVGWTANGTTK